MARQIINTGSAVNEGDSDTIRGAFIKTEENFIDLYNQTPLEGLFPATSSVNNPTQLVGSNGTDTILGVTGSISAADFNISASGFQADIFPGTYPVVGNIFRIQQAQYLTNKKAGSYIHVIAFKSGTTVQNNERYALTIGKDFFVDGVLFNGQINNQKWYISGDGNNRLFNGNGDAPSPGTSRRVGVKVDTSATSQTFQVKNEISASNFHASNLPDSDPEITGQWFVTSSDYLFGRFDYKVLCVSQG